MNNFSLPTDPLLFGRGSISNMDNIYDYPATKKAIEQKYSEIKGYLSDYTGDLDSKISELSDEEVAVLSEDFEYKSLREELNGLIQSEVLLLIKNRINSNPSAVKNIERQIEIINDVKRSVKQTERENMKEINEYLKNYSNMSFDEYKKLKSKK